MSSIVFNLSETTTVITCEIVNEHATEGGRYDVKKVTIPKHIQRIDHSAFYHCSLLEEVIFEQGSVCTEIGAFAFSKCDSLKRINLPNTIVTIDERAFLYCYSLEEIILPQTLTEIGDSAFCDCDSLRQIVIPNSITSIGYGAFANCHSLVYVYLPTSIQYIDEGAFDNCRSLSVITAPPHTNIHPDAFENCTIINCVSFFTEIENNALLQQRFNNHPLHQVCYDPAITIDSLTKAIKQINDGSNYDQGIDAFDMNALHILCYNPSVTDEMIRTFLAAFPSLRSMQSFGGITPLHIVCSNQNVTDEMIKSLIVSYPSLRSIKSDKGLTPVIMYVKNKYGNEGDVIVEDEERLSLDDFLRHKILREDEIVSMLSSDDEMQEELSMLDEIDEETGLCPFMQIASNESYNLEAMYWLLRARPHLLSNIRFNATSMDIKKKNEQDDEMEELKREVKELKKHNKKLEELMEQMRDEMEELKKQVEHPISKTKKRSRK